MEWVPLAISQSDCDINLNGYVNDGLIAHENRTDPLFFRLAAKVLPIWFATGHMYSDGQSTVFSMDNLACGSEI